MKTCSDILTNQHFIDTEPMRAAYNRLTAMTLVILDHCAGQGLLENTRQILKLVAITRGRSGLIVSWI